MSGKLNRNCVYCNADEWWSIDNREDFSEVCSKCHNIVHYKKSRFVEHFKCTNCGHTNGTLQDNDNDLTIICENCNAPNIVFKKHYVLTDNRYKTGIIIKEKPQQNSDIIKCPKCGSAQITTGARGFSLVTGFIGSGKTVNRCSRCGKVWQPKL